MENNKNLLFFVTLLALLPVIGFLIPVIVWYGKKEVLEGEAKVYLKNLVNFELLIFILSLIFGFVFAPITGLISFFNLVIIILATISVFNNKNYKFPFLLELIK
ncbi:MAG: DUF4870 domain-containing protein [Candidatus Gastranaerophilales bacterium]|nr:DUF4870 domain-containing protein [Candidatus Gastranaerophilales bacterium]